MINVDDRAFETIKKPEHMWLLLHIARRIGKNRDCWPKNYTLAKDCGWSVNTVQKYKKELKKLGLLTVQKRFVNNKQAANSYIVNTSDISLFIPLNKIPTQDVGNQSMGNQNVPTQDVGNRSINKDEVLINRSINKEKGDKQNLSNPLPLFDQFKEVLNYLTEKSGNKFRLGNEAKVKKSDKYKKITARLKEYSIEDLKAVIDVKCKEWGDSEEWCKRLVPKTLFNKTKFESYMDEVINQSNKPTAQTKNLVIDTHTLPPALEELYKKGLEKYNTKSVAQRISYFTKKEFQSWMKGGVNFEKHRDRGILTEQKIYKKIKDTINRLNSSSFDQKCTGCLVDFVELAFSNKIKQIG